MKKTIRLIFTLCFIASTTAWAQLKTIKGKVTGADDGLPLPGVSVRVSGNANAVQTFADGSYTINIPANAEKLEFTFLGYTTQTEVIGNRATINISLKTDQKKLDEVQVIGAGGILRNPKEQGYAATRISGNELTQGKSPSIAGGLVGKVAGLQINAVSSGVNPNYRLVLRGNRSILGNNEALVVVDNVIVPSTILGNLNPEDIEDITVLNGASGAAVYGSDASNGVLLVTTKKGKIGQPDIKVSHTTTLQQVSFHPKLQDRFGAGATSGAQVYDPVENQQYGPAFDGSLKPIGYPLADGTQQYATYSARTDKYDFWDTGIQNQTDFSISSGDEKSRTYIAGQYYDASGTTPKDKYNRISIRANGERKIAKDFEANYSINYVRNNYDQTSITSSVYNELLQTPASVPLLDYKDWKNNAFANPNGYYNAYYDNPYFSIDNWRSDTKNNYLTGNFELKYKPLDWLNFTYRAGITNRDYGTKTTGAKFVYTDYTKATYTSKSDYAGSVSDQNFNSQQFNTEFQTNLKKDFKDFAFSLTLAASYRDNTSKSVSVSASGLEIPELYNVGNRIGQPGASESNSHTRQFGLWGDFNVSYKKYLFLNITGRNDWVSVLAPQNRSFFYPSANLSFIPTDAIEGLKNSNTFNYIKLRAGLSKVGLVNVGAYALDPTFGSITGYDTGTYYSLSSTIVSNNLKPETTTGFETGVDFRLFKDVVDGSVTYYYSDSRNQIIPAGISNSTGYSSYYLNTGQVTNEGIESVLHFTLVRKNDWNFKVGGNYTYLENKIQKISNDLDRISIGSGGVFAIEGNYFPVIISTDYNRDSRGRVIVDINTGYPSQAAQTKILGNTQPKHRLGLDFALRWKDFTLSSLFEYRSGYVIYAAGGSTFDFSGSSARSAYYNRERFVFPNSSYLDPVSGQYVANTDVTVSDGGAGFWASGNFNRNIVSNYIVSGNYWKWREVALTYRLPKSVLGNVKFVKSASITLQGRNLLLWVPKSNEFTDPDYSFNGSGSNAIGVTSLTETPPTRYFGGTLSLTF